MIKSSDVDPGSFGSVDPDPTQRYKFKQTQSLTNNFFAENYIFKFEPKKVANP